jgi:hypothetical protein
MIMTDRDKAEARATLDDVARVDRETRAASRWWPRYIICMGVLAFALIVAVEVYFPRGAARFVAAGVWALAVVLLGWWAESHVVQPARGGRRLILAMAAWFGIYLVVIGPLVRWQAGQSLTWWSLAAAVMAVPFLVVAWRERRAT